MTNYLLYWKVTDAERKNIRSFKRTYAGGGQLAKLSCDDVLWIINISMGHLYLIGRLVVGKLVKSEEKAKDELGVDFDLWKAPVYVIAKKGTVEYMNWVNIDNMASELRFISSTGRNKLTITGSTYSVMQFRSMRELTNESAQLLNQAWYSSYLSDTTLDYLELQEDDKLYAEGKLVARSVTQRSRNRSLVDLAKKRFKQTHENRLFCEICHFDFSDLYEIEYIEAHHKNPIGNLSEKTTNKTDDLMMLCANCHRALHHPKIDNDIDKLKQLVEKNKEGREEK